MTADWANLPNDFLFFGLLLRHNGKKCLIRTTISGQTKIAFSPVSSFSTNRGPQNRCASFPETLLFTCMSIRAGESERIFHITFMTSRTFQSLALTPAFRGSGTICKLQLPISANFGSSFSSLNALNFSNTAQFVIGPSIESWFIFVFGRPSLLFAVDWCKLYWCARWMNWESKYLVLTTEFPKSDLNIHLLLL